MSTYSTFLGRRLIVDSAAPRGLRVGPGYLVLPPEEVYDLAMGDTDTHTRIMQEIRDWEVVQVANRAA